MASRSPLSFSQTKFQRALRQAYRWCEKIASRNRPYLWLSARYFSDPAKYAAFCSTYASMRQIDDQVDGIPWRGRLNSAQVSKYKSEVTKWADKISSCQNGTRQREPAYLALQETFRTIPFPLFPWLDLARAMQEDIGKDSFADFDEFVSYAHGAAIAPATVFMFLLTARKGREEYSWQFSDSEIQEFSKKLALFCYVVHIIRDVASDLKLGKGGLLYISQKDLARFGLTKDDLLRFKRTHKINPIFRKLAEMYVNRAKKFESEGRALLVKLNSGLDENSRFILTLLLEFYSATLRKIIKVRYNVFSGREKLTLAEERKVITSVAKKFGVKPEYV